MMPKQRRPQETLVERFADYERQYPQIADAMRGYTILMQTYQTAFNYYPEPRISISNSTVRLDQPIIQ